MPLGDVLDAENLVGAEWRNCCEIEARCPCCGRALLIRTNSAAQVDFRCMTNRPCQPSDILHALGLTHAALLPTVGKYRPLPWGWWRNRPRYAGGPVQPVGEQ